MLKPNCPKNRKILFVIAVTQLLLTGLASGETLKSSPPSDCQIIGLPADRELVDFKAMRERYALEQYQGFTIGEISIVRLPIFNPHDPDENNFIYRFINGIHPPTQPYVVTRQLLFTKGDSLEPRLVKETERILRDNSYLSDAIVLPKQVCGETLDLVVIVRELWTLLPKIFFSRKGGNNKYGLTLEDENLFGSGNTLFLEFIHDRERDTTAIGYRTKQLFGTRVTLDAIYSDTTDGINKKLDINRPFYALDTPWSLGVKLRERTYEETLEAFNQGIDVFDHIENEYALSAGYSAGLKNRRTQRYSYGFTRTEDLFEATDNTTSPLPADRILAYPWIQYSLVEDNFVIYRNLNVLYRTEDVPVGVEFSLTLGYADSVFDSELSQWVFALSYKDTPFTAEKHLLKSTLDIEGYWDRDSSEFLNTVSTVDLSYYWLIAKQHRAFLGLSYDYGENLTQDELLPLGGDEGLRGYPSEYLLGEQRFLVNLEHRYFFDSHYLNLFRFAGVVFLDVGKTTYNNGNGEDSELLSSAGVGLRINASKTSISRIVHLDLAFPLNEKDELDEYQVRITSDATF